MKKSLFVNDQFTETANNIHWEFEQALAVIYDKYKDKHSLRELAYLAEAANTVASLSRII